MKSSADLPVIESTDLMSEIRRESSVPFGGGGTSIREGGSYALIKIN